MQVKAGVAEFGQHRRRRDVVEVRAHARREQLALGHARRQSFPVARSFPPESAERIQEDGGGEPRRRLDAGQRRRLPCHPLIDPLCPCVRPIDIRRDHRVVVVLDAELLQHLDPHIHVLERHVTGAEERLGAAISLERVQAGSEEAKRAPRPLERIHGGPPLPHHVDERGMEGVGRTHSVTQQAALFFSLLPFGGRFRVGPLHSRDNLLI